MKTTTGPSTNLKPTVKSLLQASWPSTLFGKLVIPLVAFMLLAMLAAGFVFNYGVSASTRRIIAGEISEENQKIITSLSGRIETVRAIALVLAHNAELQTAIGQDGTQALSLLNSRALITQDRFDLDLVQFYGSNGEARTNLVQSSLYKISSVNTLLTEDGEGIFLIEERTVFLVRRDLSGGGVVILGIDLQAELDRINFQLGLHNPLWLEMGSLDQDQLNLKNNTLILRSPFLIAGQEMVLNHERDVSPFLEVARSGHLLVLAGVALTTLLLIAVVALLVERIVQPIRQLAGAAYQLSIADFENASPDFSLMLNSSNPLRIGANDEIGQLAGAFKHMAAELQNLYHGLVRDLRKANDELQSAYDSALQGWSSALELRDHDTERHTARVSEFTVSLAAYMLVPNDELVHYRRGALLHDVGKMAIPDEILLKAGPLTDKEWEIMRQHPLYAYVMLRQVAFLSRALDIPYCHHEKWDGSGYPRGLERKAIPLSARIFSVIDSWDALLSDRPYRKAWPREKVVDHIRSQSGKDFDPEVVQAFLEWVDTQEQEKNA
jgi:HAMP domain-containing protein